MKKLIIISLISIMSIPSFSLVLGEINLKTGINAGVHKIDSQNHLLIGANVQAEYLYDMYKENNFSIKLGGGANLTPYAIFNDDSTTNYNINTNAFGTTRLQYDFDENVNLYTGLNLGLGYNYNNVKEKNHSLSLPVEVYIGAKYKKINAEINFTTNHLFGSKLLNMSEKAYIVKLNAGYSF